MKNSGKEYAARNGEEIIQKRELVVMVKPEANLRVEGQRVSCAPEYDAAPLTGLLASEGATMELLFGPGKSEDQLKQESASLAVEAEEAVPDLSVYYHVEAPDERLNELAARLREQEVVEAAYVKPAAELPMIMPEEEIAQDQNADAEGINDAAPSIEEPPAATSNFTSRQGYLNPAPEGIDARYAWEIPGGGGQNVDIIDLEWGWNFNHEDLGANQGGVIAGVNSNSNNHGTAVLGEISGDRNNRGVTGISPEARVSAVAFSMPTATAIRLAADRLNSGDIMLLEIHRAGPRLNFQARDDQRGYIAIEWWPDDFAAIRYATAKGIIVVEAAGNGGENFDDPLYDQRPTGFPASWRNPFDPANASSRAVVVGAGAPPPGTNGRDHGPDRSRLGFSNFGRRIDAQGWGREVTTTGYGDLQGGTDVNRYYTATFSGTSSASPIVTAALACVQGVLKEGALSVIGPDQARTLLRQTGSPQQSAPGRPASQRIGNRPDLRELIPAAVALTPGNYSGVWLPGSGGYYLWVNASWDSFKAKWSELAGKGLRLVDFEITQVGNDTRYSGVWLPGSGGYYLWVNASWDSFKAKWSELAGKGLRLVDFEVTRVGNDTRYSGVWLPGSGGYYLWVNVNWLSFKLKWEELAKKGLRLVDFEMREPSATGSGETFPGAAEFPASPPRVNALVSEAAGDSADGQGGGALPGGNGMLPGGYTASELIDGEGGGELTGEITGMQPADGQGGGDVSAEAIAGAPADGQGGVNPYGVAILDEPVDGQGGGNLPG